MAPLKQAVKKAVFGLLGKDPEAVVVTFATGRADRVQRMAAEMRELLPDRRHFLVSREPIDVPEGFTLVRADEGEWRSFFRQYRIGAAAVLFDEEPYGDLRSAAFRLAATKILAFNARGERHHLHPRTLIASYLFWRGVPLDRIHLRPRWLAPWRRDRTQVDARYRVLEGRTIDAKRPSVLIVTPYPPYPLSHGGAVRMYHLLREAATDYDLHIATFGDQRAEDEARPLLEFCAKIAFFPMPRYREPRWSTLRPPEVEEFAHPTLHRSVQELARQWKVDLTQVEYTQLATYPGDVLVEHDVTFDLFRQIEERRPSRAARFDTWRWRRLELKRTMTYRRVVVMSDKDAGYLPGARCTVIPNGVDVQRFSPEPEPDQPSLLFVGSFQHFPNVLAYRFFTEEVWPRVCDAIPGVKLVVVTGRDPLLYWRQYTGTEAPAPDPRIEHHSFVSDVRPLYTGSQLALVPTLVSAGTNLKVLEAMAMQRAVVSTTSGCAGLETVHAESIWVADGARVFADGVIRLLRDVELRRKIAAQGRLHVERHFDWRPLGDRQKQLWRELLAEGKHA